MRKDPIIIPEDNFELNDFVLLLFNEHDTRIALNWADCRPPKEKLKGEQPT